MRSYSYSFDMYMVCVSICRAYRLYIPIYRGLSKVIYAYIHILIYIYGIDICTGRHVLRDL